MTNTLAKLSAALADRYRIERELGAGGMATVYLAEDLKHDRKVASQTGHRRDLRVPGTHGRVPSRTASGRSRERSQ